jgi:hypothetical protein
MNLATGVNVKACSPTIATTKGTINVNTDRRGVSINFDITEAKKVRKVPMMFFNYPRSSFIRTD